MNNLIPIIGLAPSEISYQELIIRLTKERERVRKAIEDFKNNLTTKVKGKKKKAVKKLHPIQILMKEKGLSLDEIKEIIKKGGEL